MRPDILMLKHVSQIQIVSQMRGVRGREETKISMYTREHRLWAFYLNRTEPLSGSYCGKSKYFQLRSSDALQIVVIINNK